LEALLAHWNKSEKGGEWAQTLFGAYWPAGFEKLESFLPIGNTRIRRDEV